MLKKKLLLLLFLFFLMPTVYASSSIRCIYSYKNYTLTFNVTDANSGKIVFNAKKNGNGDKLKFKVVKNIDDFKKNKKLSCPSGIFSKENNKLVTITFKKTKSATKNDLSLNYSSTDAEQLSPTDWGSVNDTDLETICSKPEFRKPLKFIGTLVSVIKIAIPILIIVFGIIDLFKAITSSKDDRIMVAIKSIGVRFIAGIFIFFIPGIVQLILDWVNEWSNYQNTWCCCTQCILDSGKCDVNSCSSDSCKIGGMN